ncbi:tRNA adenosine(34) deaminase TadA [Gammaproteobacteria bacterium]|jgi:tRNA(adenine34) deaminase|nr:tRNA adenosine(34) deaminase TadA [Gammaproteobacteria bacterium]
MNGQRDDFWMQKAFNQAKLAEYEGEVPVGAVVIIDNQLIAQGFNQPIQSNDATAHAEIVAIRKAGILVNNYRLVGAQVYVTLEPCIMCLGAMMHARISRLVYGASDSKFAATTKLSVPFEVTGGVMSKACQQLIQQFFRQKR